MKPGEWSRRLRDAWRALRRPPVTMEEAITRFADDVTYLTEEAPVKLLLHPRSYRDLLAEVWRPGRPVERGIERGMDFTVGYAAIRIEPVDPASRR